MKICVCHVKCFIIVRIFILSSPTNEQIPPLLNSVILLHMFLSFWEQAHTQRLIDYLRC